MISHRLILSAVVFTLCAAGALFAQQGLPFQRVSPQAEVRQNIGNFVTVTINYSSPAVNGREVYGQLVPYGLASNNFGNGKPMPWRAGANENTVITFSHDVMIEGENLPAGTYGLHMIPGEKEWVVIFNKNHDAWGSFFYEEDQDVLRVNVKPQSAPHMENLAYYFDELSFSGATAFLHWEKKRVPFKISIDDKKITVEEYRKLLTNLQGFNPAAYAAAAQYCLQNSYNLEEAMAWADRALNMPNGATFGNKSVKAGLLTATGQKEKADQMMESAIAGASEAELNTYGYQLMNTNRLDEAIRIFKLNVERHPDSWNVYDSLGEALNNKGDRDGALANYKKALEMAPAGQHSRINTILQGI